MATTINYIWTDADNLIQIAASKTPPAACAGYPQCNTGTPHRCYVTPYGLLPDEAHAPGDEVTIDLTHSRESWRATRFHLDSAWRPSQASASTPSDGSWEKIDIPDSVTNLKGLCVHLQKTNPDLYPAAFYANEGAACRMLFDYWENGRYRNAVLKADPQIWTKYNHDPGSIPVKQGDAALTHVVHYVHSASAASAAPGAPMQLTVDSLDQRIEDFIAELDRQSSRVEEMIALSDRVLTERYELLRALHAVHEIGRVVPADGDSTGPALAEAIGAWGDEGSVIARFREFLMGLPVKQGNWSAALQAQAPWWRTSDYTINAKEDATAAANRLNDLLLSESNVALVADLREWGGQVAVAMAADKLTSGGDAPPESAIPPGVHVAGVEPVRPRLADQLDRLTLAASRACMAAAGMGIGPDANTLLAKFDAAPATPAQSPSDVKGKSVLELIFTLIGRFASVGGAAFGNLAGPPSLSISALGWWAARDFLIIAQKVKDLGANAKVLVEEHKSRLLKRYVSALDGTVTADEIEKALAIDASKEVQKSVAQRLSKSRMNRAQRSWKWNVFALVMQFVQTGYSLYQALTSDEPIVGALDWIGTVASGGMLLVGAVDAALDARFNILGICDDAAALELAGTLLSKTGLCFSLLGALTGLLTGGYSVVLDFFGADAAKKTTKNTISDVAGLVGSGASVALTALMMAEVSGPATLTLGIIIVASLAVTGFLTLDDFAYLSPPASAATGLLSKATSHQLWKAFVAMDPSAKDLTERLETMGKGPLPFIPPTDEAAKETLRRVSFPETWIGQMTADITRSSAGGSSGSGTESAYSPAAGAGGAGAGGR